MHEAVNTQILKAGGASFKNLKLQVQINGFPPKNIVNPVENAVKFVTQFKLLSCRSMLELCAIVYKFAGSAIRFPLKLMTFKEAKQAISGI